jgi:Secretion system C-terminal sorting domain
MKGKLFILILSLLVTALKAQTIQSDSEYVYNVDPGTKGNQIIMDISNVSHVLNANNIVVKLIKSSKQLEFEQNQQTIDQIDKNKEAEVTFEFAVNLTAPANKEDTVEFQINSESVDLKKIFILQYTAPKQFALYQNYPNPFNPATTIRYSIPNTGAIHVSLRIYNILGEEVASLIDRKQTAGNYEIKFDAARYASGVYIYRLVAGNFVSIKKMMFIK